MGFPGIAVGYLQVLEYVMQHFIMYSRVGIHAALASAHSTPTEAAHESETAEASRGGQRWRQPGGAGGRVAALARRWRQCGGIKAVLAAWRHGGISRGGMAALVAAVAAVWRH